jgi:pimeloyl-ACP methyl ester carboxylesterase
MLHGFSQNGDIFECQAAHFGAKYRVFVAELLGHGQRDLATSDYGLASLARDVLVQLHEREITRTHFWGTHTGTSVGLLLALDRPSLIASLVLEGAVVPGIEMPTVAAHRARAEETARRSGVRAAMQEWFERADWFRTIRARPTEHRADEQKRIVLDFPGRPLLLNAPTTPISIIDRVRDVRCPTLVYNGADDLEDFKHAAAFLADNLPCVQRVELPGLGGFPAWESPSTSNALVERFLDEARMSPQ